MKRPKLFPRFTINFEDFCKGINTAIIRDKDIDKETYIAWYVQYKHSQYSLKLVYVLKNGYQSPYNWANEFFKDYTLDENGIQLWDKYLEYN